MPGRFDNGVGYYTRGTVLIGFPEDDICCHWCPLLDREFSDKETRFYCKKTGEFIPAPQYMIGLNCPVKFETKEE